VRCKSLTVSSLGFSATNSSRLTRSYWRSSAGSNVCALASVSSSHAGWSVRSLSLLVLTNEARSATDSNAYRSSSLPRNASHSSPSSRQRGAHNVYRSPLVSPSRIGTMSAAMAHSLTTAAGDLDGHRPKPALRSSSTSSNWSNLNTSLVKNPSRPRHTLVVTGYTSGANEVRNH